MRSMPLASLVLLVAAAGAAAQDNPESPIAPASDPWTLKFEPAAWYLAVNGNIRLPGATGAGNGETYTAGDLNLDSPRLSPFGELQIRRGDWRISIEGLGFSTDDRGAVMGGGGQIGGATFATGDTLRSSMDLVTFSVDGAYAFHRFEGGELAGGGSKVRSTLLALGGVRALDVSIDTQVLSSGSVSGTAGGDAMQAHPYGGLRWELDLWEKFTVDLVGAVGGLDMGDNESWSADIWVGFQWNPTPYLGAQVGYRQLLMGVERGAAPGEFAWQGGIAGVYAGVTLRF
ncbi:MAG: hypothetical protein IPJ41_17740 [Phycisphaerales bacterium]|nr:hypothetical protein [Phycisphaerales bacterium]